MDSVANKTKERRVITAMERMRSSPPDQEKLSPYLADKKKVEPLRSSPPQLDKLSPYTAESKEVVSPWAVGSE